MEVTERVESVSLLADRLQALLQAVVSIGSQLDLPEVLHRIVETAAELATLSTPPSAFSIPVARVGSRSSSPSASTTDVRAEIGDLPHGRGVLGVLITEPRAIRLTNLAITRRRTAFPPGHPPDAHLPRRADQRAR